MGARWAGWRQGGPACGWGERRTNTTQIHVLEKHCCSLLFALQASTAHPSPASARSAAQTQTVQIRSMARSEFVAATVSSGRLDIGDCRVRLNRAVVATAAMASRVFNAKCAGQDEPSWTKRPFFHCFLFPCSLAALSLPRCYVAGASTGSATPTAAPHSPACRQQNSKSVKSMAQVAR